MSGSSLLKMLINITHKSHSRVKYRDQLGSYFSGLGETRWRFRSGHRQERRREVANTFWFLIVNSHIWWWILRQSKQRYHKPRLRIRLNQVCHLVMNFVMFWYSPTLQKLVVISFLLKLNVYFHTHCCIHNFRILFFKDPFSRFPNVQASGSTKPLSALVTEYVHCKFWCRLINFPLERLYQLTPPVSLKLC